MPKTKKRLRYPEHEKLKALGSERTTVQSFIDWLYDMQGCEIAFWEKNRIEDRLCPIRQSREDLMASFFKINLKKLDAEKRAMLDELRRANGIETD
jgi:hypothetical protein